MSEPRAAQTNAHRRAKAQTIICCKCSRVMSNVTVLDTQNSRPAGRTNTTEYIDPCVTHIDLNKKEGEKKKRKRKSSPPAQVVNTRSKPSVS